jgi:hypothetical protein
LQVNRADRPSRAIVVWFDELAGASTENGISEQ